MRSTMPAVIGIVAPVSASALAEDGRATFERRRDVMKATGRALDIGVGGYFSCHTAPGGAPLAGG